MQNFEQCTVDAYTRQAYHNYATYVILDRAIPRIEDGLKPVQRRTLYAMAQMGLKAHSKPKKSAKTVGDVIGKFHPHGDSSVYEAMVLMAQSFSYRYPLIQGQGNWGSIDDPKSFAAYRYTEATLTAYTQLIIGTLNAHTVSWGPNFDGSLTEPNVFPARLPNILLNGASGIAVGMATDIPPHNLKEVGKACIHLLRHPNATLESILKILPAPDYPTGAEIINSPQELRQIAETGQGQIRQRGVIEVLEDQLIIRELPYQTTSSRIIKQIADLMIAKRLPQIKNVRDESDEDHLIMIVLTLKNKKQDTDEVLEYLFAETDLERTQKININYINTDRKPVSSGILPLLKNWLLFRENTLIRELTHSLNVANARLHILKGLLTIFDHIDQVLKIIRFDDTPKETLMATFSLTEEQATAILETRLKHLAKLQQQQLQEESTALILEIERLNALLSSSGQRTQHIITEIKSDMSQFGDSRRTVLIEREASSRKPTTLKIPQEAISIVVSKQGWIRSAKNHDLDLNSVTFKSGDQLSQCLNGYSHWPTLFFDDAGYAYTIQSHQLPNIRTKGDPITKYLHLNGSLTQHVINAAPSQQVMIVSTQGYGFISTIDALSSRNRAGKKAISLGESSLVFLDVVPEPSTHIAMATQQGRLLIIALNDIPQLDKGKGNKLIAIHKIDHQTKADQVIHACCMNIEDTLVLTSGKRTYKITPKEQMSYIASRGKRGTLLPRGFRLVHGLHSCST